MIIISNKITIYVKRNHVIPRSCMLDHGLDLAAYRASLMRKNIGVMLLLSQPLRSQLKSMGVTSCFKGGGGCRHGWK